MPSVLWGCTVQNTDLLRSTVSYLLSLWWTVVIINKFLNFEHFHLIMASRLSQYYESLTVLFHVFCSSVIKITPLACSVSQFHSMSFQSHLWIMTSVGDVWGEVDCNYFSVKAKLQSALQCACDCCMGPHFLFIRSKWCSFLTFHYLSKAGDPSKMSWLKFNLGWLSHGRAEVILEGEGKQLKEL